MKRWLQEFSFKKSFYERPNQKWICGRACLGEGCIAGPDAKGSCGATTECRPLKKGDRWFCTRPNLLGGPCADGPSPGGSCCREIPKCNPVRSLRSRRGLVVLFVLAASLAFVFWLLTSQSGTTILSPGELSFAHASANSKCADCHEGTTGTPASWLAKDATHVGSVDTKLCLNCHNVGASPTQPHSLPEQKLQSITEAVQKNSGTPRTPARLQFASFAAGQPHSDGTQLDCATCHKEHRGQKSDLKILSNNQCQSCHAVQFDRFAKGHPQFTKYPFERRTRIIFDHESHLQKHFTEAEWKNSAPASCLDCHQTETKGGAMLVKSFETSCAACHEDQIKGKGSVQPGVAVISLPRLDDRVLTGDYAIGEWPEDADQPMAPLLKLLLSGDPTLRVALDKLGNTDLSDLPKSDVEKVKAAQQIAWGIKGLIFDLSTGGQTELTKRLEAVLSRPLSNHDKESATALLSAEVLRTSFQTSFPKLQNEVIDYRSQKIAETDLVSSPPLAKSKIKTATADAWVNNGGWYSPDGSFTLYYRPRGHSDRFFNFWMNLTVDAEKTANPAVAQASFNEIAAPKAAGFCAKCHSADDTPENLGNLVNWFAARPNPTEHKFNRFSHSTHMSLLNDTGCFTCHPMGMAGGEKTFSSAFEKGQRDASQFQSNFQLIKRETCAQCHTSQLANDNCLLCHNYHIGTFKGAEVKMKSPRANGALETFSKKP